MSADYPHDFFWAAVVLQVMHLLKSIAVSTYRRLVHCLFSYLQCTYYFSPVMLTKEILVFPLC